MQAKQKEANLAVKRAEKQGTRKLSDIDNKVFQTVKKSFTRLGYSSSDAKQATEVALKKTSSRDVQTVLKAALKEVAALQQRK